MSVPSPHIIYADGMTFAGYDARYEMSDTNGIPAQWERFAPQIMPMVGKAECVAYGVLHDMSENAFGYLAAVRLAEDVPMAEGFTVLHLPAQRYAVFEHPGHVSTLCQTIDAAWCEWLPQSGYAAAEPGFLLERYGEGFDPETGQGDIQVWLAITAPAAG